MLKPAFLLKNEIEKEIIDRFYYTDKMFYATASVKSYLPTISTDNDIYQYAILNKNKKLIGYIEYAIEFYESKAYNFLLFSFADNISDKFLFGKEVLSQIEKILCTCHRIEWKAVQGNKACKAYDNLIKRYSHKDNCIAEKLILHDSSLDKYHYYHDDYIYQIINFNNNK
jgi:hypothetical protein